MYSCNIAKLCARCSHGAGSRIGQFPAGDRSPTPSPGWALRRIYIYIYIIIYTEVFVNFDVINKTVYTKCLHSIQGSARAFCSHVFSFAGLAFALGCLRPGAGTDAAVPVTPRAPSAASASKVIDVVLASSSASRSLKPLKHRYSRAASEPWCIS